MSYYTSNYTYGESCEIIPTGSSIYGRTSNYSYGSSLYTKEDTTKPRYS